MSEICGDTSLDERGQAMMERRHRNGLIALRLEQFLTQESTNNYSGVLTEREVKDLLAEFRDQLLYILEMMDLGETDEQKERMYILKQGLEYYFLEVFRAKTVERRLMAEVDMLNRNLSPTSLGRYVFSKKTNSGPRGSVFFRRHGAYFAIHFSDPSDYEDFTAATDYEDGQYHRCFSLGAESLRLMAINGIQDVEHVIEHEAQHLIHDLFLNRFSGFESSNQFTSLYPQLSYRIGAEEPDHEVVSKALRVVKDELLAFVVDGEAFEEAFSTLFQTRAYAYLKRVLSEIEFGELEQLMAAMKGELVHLFELFDQPKKRALLAYLLADVPLVRFPERLLAIKCFYEHQPQLLSNLHFPIGSSVDLCKQPASPRYSSKLSIRDPLTQKRRYIDLEDSFADEVSNAVIDLRQVIPAAELYASKMASLFRSSNKDGILNDRLEQVPEPIVLLLHDLYAEQGDQINPYAVKAVLEKRGYTLFAERVNLERVHEYSKFAKGRLSKKARMVERMMYFGREMIFFKVGKTHFTFIKDSSGSPELSDIKGKFDGLVAGSISLKQVGNLGEKLAHARVRSEAEFEVHETCFKLLEDIGRSCCEQIRGYIEDGELTLAREHYSQLGRLGYRPSFELTSQLELAELQALLDAGFERVLDFSTTDPHDQKVVVIDYIEGARGKEVRLAANGSGGYALLKKSA